MAALIQFVDSISASPTVRLDVNDALSWFCRSFKAPPPRLRRSVSQNAMRDGQHVSSSSYDARELTLELTLIEEADEDYAAQEMQKLWRELDRETNFLLYHPDGLDKPVFFVLQRSDVEDLEELWTSPIARNITIVLPAEPKALGGMETLGPYTVSNDPAAPSSGCYFDVSGVIGDVATPAVIQSADGLGANLILGLRDRGIPSDLVFFAQAESMVLGNDTTNPGGGPDAVMSGTGTNNYLRTTFATTPGFAGVGRCEWRMTTAGYTDAQKRALRGTFRVMAVVRRNGTTSAITARFTYGSTTGSTAIVPVAAERMWLDLGLVSIGCDAPAGYSGSVGPAALDSLILDAARSGGSDTLDWDYVLLVPADSAQLVIEGGTTGVLFDGLIDGVNEVAFEYGGGTDPFAGASEANAPLASAGSFPMLRPEQDARIVLLTAASTSGVPLPHKTRAMAVTVHYWPAYLYVRPSAS